MNLLDLTKLFFAPAMVFCLASCSPYLREGEFKFATRKATTQEIFLGSIGTFSHRKGFQNSPASPTKSGGIYLPKFARSNFVTERETLKVIQSHRIADRDAPWVCSAIEQRNFRPITFNSPRAFLHEISSDIVKLRLLRELGKDARVITAVIIAFDPNLITAEKLGGCGILNSLGIRLPIDTELGLQSHLIRYEDFRVVGYRYAKPTWSAEGYLTDFKPDNKWSFCSPGRFPTSLPLHTPSTSK